MKLYGLDMPAFKDSTALANMVLAEKVMTHLLSVFFLPLVITRFSSAIELKLQSHPWEWMGFDGLNHLQCLGSNFMIMNLDFSKRPPFPRIFRFFFSLSPSQLLSFGQKQQIVYALLSVTSKKFYVGTTKNMMLLRKNLRGDWESFTTIFRSREDTTFFWSRYS